MKKLVIITFLSLCTAGLLQAQSITSVTYSVGFPSGDLKDFITKTSWRGINFDFQKMVQPNIGVGFSMGWNVFYEDLAYDTYTVDNISLSGKQWRYSNHIPLLISSSYYLKPGEQLNPFVGLGVGTIYSIRNTDMNLYTIEEEAWNFALQPSIGVLIQASDVTSFHVSMKYNYGFQAGSELQNAQSYLALNVGFTFGN